MNDRSRQTGGTLRGENTLYCAKSRKSNEITQTSNPQQRLTLALFAIEKQDGIVTARHSTESVKTHTFMYTDILNDLPTMPTRESKRVAHLWERCPVRRLRWPPSPGHRSFD